jgi:hypothetical protein
MMSNEEELDWSAGRTTSEKLAKQILPDARVYCRFDLRPAVTADDRVGIRSDSLTRLVPKDSSQAGIFCEEAIT